MIEKGFKRRESYQLKEVLIDLLLGRTWRLLRYLHARRALLHASDVKTVLVVGAGGGLAEIALALEFPEKNFILTEQSVAEQTFARAKYYTERFALSNVSFKQLDILDVSSEAKYDLVYSIEVLEHIKDHQKASESMRSLANKYIFCLVPFAETEVAMDATIRQEAYDRNGHYVPGYNQKELEALFPGVVLINGCYWNNHGCPFRRKITKMSNRELKVDFANLFQEAQQDVRDAVQHSVKEARGIWILSKNI